MESVSEKLYELTFSPRAGYLHAYVSGQHDSFEISSGYWGEIAKQLKFLGMDKVLIVEDIVEESPMLDVYYLATQLGSLGFKGIKVAFVDRQTSHKEQNEFGVLVGTNCGLTGRAFTDEAEAEKWLLG